MESKKAYVVRYDGSSNGQSKDLVILTRSDSLDSAIEAMQASRYTAHVLHQASNLELHKIGERLIWLDSNGSECPAPA